jgi:hypothetical protein
VTQETQALPPVHRASKGDTETRALRCTKAKGDLGDAGATGAQGEGDTGTRALPVHRLEDYYRRHERYRCTRFEGDTGDMRAHKVYREMIPARTFVYVANILVNSKTARLEITR